MTKRKKKRRSNTEALKKYYTPRTRRGYLDYDYLERLSKEELDYLGRFTAEFYGADFVISPTYIKNTPEHLANIKREEEHEWLATKPKGRYIQVNERDLRRYRSIQKFYKTPSGRFSKSDKYKYSDENLHDTPAKKSLCNNDAKDNKMDMMAGWLRSGGEMACMSHFRRNALSVWDLNPEKLIGVLQTFDEELGEDYMEQEFTQDQLSELKNHFEEINIDDEIEEVI